MIRYNFTKDEEEFIIKHLPKSYKTLYEVISVKVIVDNTIKVKVRIKRNGEVMDDYVMVDDMTAINRELILNNLLK